MRDPRVWLTITAIVLLMIAASGCATVETSGCAGFRLNDLTPEGNVALLGVDPEGHKNVTLNDANYRERGCGQGRLPASRTGIPASVGR